MADIKELKEWEKKRVASGPPFVPVLNAMEKLIEYLEQQKMTTALRSVNKQKSIMQALRGKVEGEIKKKKNTGTGAFSHLGSKMDGKARHRK